MATWINKWFLIFLVPAGIYISQNVYDDKKLFLNSYIKADSRETSDVSSESRLHPLHVSVIEVNHNSPDKTLEISCKLFTDDFEKALAQYYKTKVDLINPTDRAAMEKLVGHFIQSHFSLKANGKPLQLLYLGYERDNDAIYSFFQADNITTVNRIEVTNNILHEQFTDQVNLMHVIVGGKRKSTKLDYPDKEAVFSF